MGAWRKRLKHLGRWGAFDSCTACLELDTPFVRDAEEVAYQLQIAVLLADLWLRKAVPTVANVAISCVHEDLRQLWLVVIRRYRAHEHHFETRLGVQHYLLVG